MQRTEVRRYGDVTVRVSYQREESAMTEIAREVYSGTTIIDVNEHSVRDEAVEAAEGRVRREIERLLKEKKEQADRLVDADSYSEEYFDVEFDKISEYVQALEDLAKSLQLDYESPGW